MSHTQIDMKVEGNGSLPIVISRTSTQSGDSRAEYALYNQVIAMPRLYFASESYDGEDWNCDSNETLFLTNRNLNRNNSRMLNTPITFIDGEVSIPFFSTDPLESPANISRFPSGADYVSHANRYIDCIDQNGDGYEDFTVFSPDGTKYIMGQGSGSSTSDTDGSQGNANLTFTTWRVTKVIDVHGNWLEYLYGSNGSNIWPAQHSSNYRDYPLTRIKAKDGREVKLTYTGTLQLVEALELGTTKNRKVTYNIIDNYDGAGNSRLSVTYDDTYSRHYDCVGKH
jgi:hypothetical protein